VASSDPIGDGLAALYALLSGDATFMGYLSGGLWELVAPLGTAPDFAVIANQTATDVKGAMGARLMTSLLYQVKVMGPRDDEANLRTAYKRADALLQPSLRALANYGGTLAIYRESMLPEDGGIINGVQWLAIGGLYRVEV
jgi:hypothetical protein